MVSKASRSGSRILGARALFHRLCAKWTKQKKKTGESVFLGCRNVLFLFLFFSSKYQSIYMHGGKDKDITSWIHWDWYHKHVYSLLFWQPFQIYINTICKNVNKMESSHVFANSFTVMYKSVFCFLCVQNVKTWSIFCQVPVDWPQVLIGVQKWCITIYHCFRWKLIGVSALFIIDIYMSVSFYCAKVATCKHACSLFKLVL